MAAGRHVVLRAPTYLEISRRLPLVTHRYAANCTHALDDAAKVVAVGASDQFDSCSSVLEGLSAIDPKRHVAKIRPQTYHRINSRNPSTGVKITYLNARNTGIDS
jgi:hypothetical protein